VTIFGAFQVGERERGALLIKVSTKVSHEQLQ
jgi:hypothetical protein